MNTNISQDLTIVLVSFNSGKVILETLGALLNNNPCRIIIVDNASKDDSALLIKNAFSHIELIESSTNIGYGRAANIGFSKVSTDYCLLISPDVALNQSQLEELFYDCVNKSPEASVYAPATKERDHLKKGHLEVNYLIGAILLFKMSALKDVGFFDENYFLFYEEKDLELRLIHKGYKLILQSDIYVQHIGGASLKPSKNVSYLRNWHVAWSSLYYFYKHGYMNRNYQAILLMYKYFLKSLLSTNSEKRLKFRARFFGCKAYLNGEKAFEENGVAKLSETLTSEASN